MVQEPGAGETRWLGSVDQTALVWVGATDGGRSADGGGGGSVCVGGVEKVVCESAGVGRDEGEAAGSPQGGCWGPPEKVVRG